MVLHYSSVPLGASRIEPLDPEQVIEFTAILCAKNPLPDIHHTSTDSEVAGGSSAPQRPAYLDHAELWRSYGAAPHAVEVVTAFAQSHHLELRESSSRRRSMGLRGRAADVAHAFNTSFTAFDFEGNRSFVPTLPPTLPPALEGVVETLLGLDRANHRWRHKTSMVHGRGTPARLHDLAAAYSFPQGLDGTGETIGLLEFGGGFYPEDIDQFCSSLGIATPRITVVELAGAANRPANRRSLHEFLHVVSGTLELSAKAEQSDSFVAAQCTAEVTMDIEIVAALAPGAHIVVYFAPLDEQGLYSAISRAVQDEQNRLSVLSISWGVPEQSLVPAEMHAIEDLLREAGHQGITVCASSGDNGALNGSADGRPSVNYPASSPHCLACGGTSARVRGAEIADEVVWNASHFGVKGASGGGISERFARPAWQDSAQIPPGPDGNPGRGVPDVAGLADPRYGCELLVGGKPCSTAGTSAVAPLWAALIARLNQGLNRRCGHLHPHLYRLGRDRLRALRPVIKGNNGVYQAGEGWNACTGYGTPRGTELLDHLRERLQGD